MSEQEREQQQLSQQIDAGNSQQNTEVRQNEPQASQQASSPRQDEPQNIQQASETWQNEPQANQPNPEPWQSEPQNNQQTSGAWQDGLYNQNAPYGQNGPYNQNAPYGQNGPYNQNVPYGQNGPYNQNAPYGQNGPYNQNAPYGQSGPYNQNVPYGQNGPYNQNAPYGGPQQNALWSNQPNGQNQPPKQKNSFATISLVVGIFGLLTLCCMAFPIAIIMGVGAIAFAVISKQGRSFSGPAIAGIILGIFCIVLGIGEFLYVMALSSFMSDPENAAMFNEFYNQLERQLQ